MTLMGYILYNILCMLVNECIHDAIIYNHNTYDSVVNFRFLCTHGDVFPCQCKGTSQ